MVRGRAQVGDHDVAGDPGLHGGVHGADRGVAVHRPGALGVAAAGAGGPDDDVHALELVRELLGGQLLDIEDLGGGPGLLDVLDLVLAADPRGDLVARLDQQGSQPQRDLAVASDHDDAGHVRRPF